MDPWGNAAAQYNQGLGQLAQINQQGYQAQAQGPASIYDRFLQGYVQAKQMRMQEEAAKREAEFKQQQLDIQRQRWQQEDQQTKLRETAKVQASIAQNYRPELRGSIAAELKAINPEWDDKKIESILPPRTPETIQIDGNEPLPLMPNDPVTLKNPAMQDTFKGMNVIREENDAKQAEARVRRDYDIQIANANSRQELEKIRAEMAMKLQELKGSQAQTQLQVKIDAGAYAPRGQGQGLDMVDPGNAAAIDALAERAIVSGDLSGLGMGNNPLKAAVIKRMGERINAAGGGTPSLAGNKAEFKANTKSLTDLQAMADNINAFEKTAIGNWSRFEKAITDLGNTGSPAFNRPINWLRTNAAGDPKVSAAIAAGQAAHTEFARIINNPRLVGVLTDNAREEVFRSLPKNFEDATPAQIKRVGDILRADAAQRKQDLNTQIGEIKGRIGGGSSPAQILMDKAKGGGERKQFKNNSTGAMEWFTRGSDGKWVKE